MDYSYNNKTPFEKFKEKFKKFWHTENGKLSMVRDIVIALALVLILLSALWAYTGQWWGTPMVAIESGSMVHPDEPFGRFGTIDAGDMVLLVKVEKRSDIITRGSSKHGALERQNPDEYFYGDYGDVIVYHPYGQEGGEQIIHRAMCWVDYNEGKNGKVTYTVLDYGIFDDEFITIKELGLEDYKPSHSGFITKGDNNNIADQLSNKLCDEPIKVEWISGKARQELPWIGTINLFFNDLTSGGNTVSNVQTDCIICLCALIIILISIPIILDISDYFKNQKNKPKHNNFVKNPYKKDEHKEFNNDMKNNWK